MTKRVIEFFSIVSLILVGVPGILVALLDFIVAVAFLNHLDDS